MKRLLQRGKRKWFFVSVDYALGHGLVADATRVIRQAGGEVVGEARHPLGEKDVSDQLRQAEASGADVIALANAGGDMITAIRTAYEQGLFRRQDVSMVSLLNFIHIIRSVGVYTSSGLISPPASTGTWTPAPGPGASAFAPGRASRPTGTTPACIPP